MLDKVFFLNLFNIIFFSVQDNPHKLTLVMTPDATYEERRISKEADKLKFNGYAVIRGGKGEHIQARVVQIIQQQLRILFSYLYKNNL